MPKFAELQSVMVGSIKVTFLPDGGGVVEPLALYPASNMDSWHARYTHLLDEQSKFITSIGGYLIETEDRKVIVDTGIGPVTIPFPGFGPFSGGEYLNSLAKTGVKPEAITDVIFTHLHLDHVGWTTVENEAGERVLTFPNARYVVTKDEWDFWYGGDNPAGPHPDYVQKPLDEVIEFVADEEELVSGVTVLDTAGHTPGHISLCVQDGGEKLYLTADLLHGAMQVTEPDWSVAFDADQAAARATRERMYALLTQPDVMVGVNHFSNIVFGKLVVDDDGNKKWVPNS